MERTLVLVLLLVPLALVVYIVGVRILASFSRPVPEPPPPGELRRVRLEYRCSLCGSEVRMTRAPTEEPEPPRCCMEPMELVAAPER
jgi:hypothetical protein